MITLSSVLSKGRVWLEGGDKILIYLSGQDRGEGGIFEISFVFLVIGSIASILVQAGFGKLTHHLKIDQLLCFLFLVCLFVSVDLLILRCCVEKNPGTK